MILSESYKRKLQELAGIVSESKKSEELGIAILRKGNIQNPEDVIDKLRAIDKSVNQKNIPNMAYFVTRGHNDMASIESVFADYDQLEKLKKIKPINYTKEGIKLGDKTFTDFLKFSEYVHGEKNKYATKSTASGSFEVETEEKPIWEGNGIEIYEGNGVGKCIKFTQGGLTGRAYSFCIGQPANTMYQSYRDTKASSFYFIVDKNRDLSDPLHIVVFDNTQHGIELTDANNTTGTIAEYGSNPQGYIGYLKSKGVPTDILINRPMTPEEQKEQELLGKQNTSLEWFAKLPFDYKSKYIGRGHLLSDEQFDYLLGAA